MTSILNLGKVRMAGRWKLTAIRPDGRRRPLTGWFNNLITDVGLEAMGAESVYVHSCVVGTGNTAPAFGDTALATQVASTTALQESTTSGAQATEPWYGWNRRVFRFAAGVAAGNLAEIGVKSFPSGILFSRALILDSGGSPTTITVLADEILDASYEIRNYPPLVDVNGTITLDGVLRDTVLRANEVDDGSHWGPSTSQVAGKTAGTGQTNAGQCSNGTLGAIDAAPGAGSTVQFPLSNSAYVAASLERQFSCLIGTSAGNFTPGISVYRFNTTLGSFKVSFDPVLDKTDQMTLSLVAKVAWGRH